MNFIKIITVLNWVVVGVLALLVIAETVSPAKGGDAAGRGMGQAIYYFSIIVLVVLVVLNLLPFTWAKYTAFGILVLPVLFLMLSPAWRKLKRQVANRIEYAKPIFEDPERDKIARAIRDGEPEQLKKLLQTPVARLDEGGEILFYATNEAAGATYKPEEKMACVRILLDAGANLDSANTLEDPILLPAVANGNAALMRLLLEHGVNPNSRQYYSTRHAIFEAVESYREPEAAVRVLLEFGADPNVQALFDDEKGKVTPLYRAAQMGRWGVCAALLEKGADAGPIAKDGTSFQTLFDEANKGFSPDGYATKEDFERVKALVQER